jgi:putative toxin-antitoxin system antitoxin component (TIGR02293 family)
MVHALSFSQILGGAKVLGRDVPRSDIGWHAAVERGLPYAALRSLARSVAFTDVELAGVIGIAKSTLNRRKHEGRFGVDESDRIYRTARVFALAHAALGDPENVGAWLREPNGALGGTAPLSLLRTEAGAREAEALVGRFLFGGYS